MSLLERWDCSKVAKPSLVLESVEKVDTDNVPTAEAEDDLEVQAPPYKKSQTDALRDNIGKKPSDIRNRLRSAVADGFYISVTEKKEFRKLHRLGACFSVPRVDHKKYSFAGVDIQAQHI